jgi:hypothetical protein
VAARSCAIASGRSVLVGRLGCAVAAAAGQVEPDDVVRLEGDAGLGADRLAVDTERSGGARLAAEDPSGGSASRLVTALSCHGRWCRPELDGLAEPAGLGPGPPDPTRSAFFVNRIGADASTTSIGTAATPVGYEQASRPGFVARAPTPPA